MIRNKEGFGLPELMTGIVLFALVSLTIINLAILITNIQTSSRYQEAATLAGQREIEALRNSNYASLTAGQNIDFTSDLPSDLPSGKNATAAISEPAAGLKRADITITYPQGGHTKTVKLTAIIGQLGITQ